MAGALGPETSQTVPGIWVIMSRISHSFIYRTIIWAAFCLIITAGVGCSPKRVVNNEILTGNTPPAKKKPATSGNNSQPGSRPKPPPTNQPGQGAFGPRAVSLAKQQLGKMYQWGGRVPIAMIAVDLFITYMESWEWPCPGFLRGRLRWAMKSGART